MSALTLPQHLLQRAETDPQGVALRQKSDTGWASVTWRAYAQRARACAAGLLELELAPPRHAAILAEGRTEWVIAQMAIGLAGGVAFGCYPTSSLEELRHALGHGDAQIVFCENAAFLEKIEAIWDDLPNLKQAVVMEPGWATTRSSDVIGFDRLEQIGGEVLRRRPDALDCVAQEQSLDDVGLMVYTSGSTGQPKGALLSYRNMQTAGEALVPNLGLGPGSVVLSYLPLCHIAEQAMTNIGPMMAGATACFGGGLPTLLEDLRAVRPTYFSGVPRVWQKIQDEIVRHFDQSGRADALRDPHPDVMAEARALVGLERAAIVTSGAAPLHVDTAAFLRALGFPLLELYGMTEACSVMAMQRPGEETPGSAGRPVDTVEIKLAEDGEILVRGENVFTGYYKDPQATAAALSGDWLHTGDIGIFADGQLRIVDRKKDIMITDGGKNIAPAEIEALMRTSPLIEECVLVADRRKFVAALIQAESPLRNPDLPQQIAREVQRLNQSLARVAQVKRVYLLEEPLRHDLGDLTPTLKLRRFKVHQRYAAVIEGIYAGRLGFDVEPGR